MVAYNVTDRGGYEEVSLVEWGDTTSSDAVHGIDGDALVLVILEPLTRTQPSWSEDDEFNFRSDVLSLVSGFVEKPDILIYDPDRDYPTTEEVN